MNQDQAESAYSVPLHIQILRRILRPAFRFVFLILSRVTINGLENVPKRGAYLIAINHVSLFEAPFVLAFWPKPPEAVGASDIWSRPGQSLLARLYGGIPVHRGEYDRKLLERIMEVLRSGRPMLIAPEGRRSHTPGMQRGMPGIAYITDKVPVAVLPVGITGATDDFLSRALHLERPALQMQIGEPFYLPPVEGKGEERRQSRQRNVDRIMLQIAALLPEEYRGFYAGYELRLEETGKRESPPGDYPAA